VYNLDGLPQLKLSHLQTIYGAALAVRLSNRLLNQTHCLAPKTLGEPRPPKHQDKLQTRLGVTSGEELLLLLLRPEHQTCFLNRSPLLLLPQRKTMHLVTCGGDSSSTVTEVEVMSCN